jgi:hypothetical protein
MTGAFNLFQEGLESYLEALGALRGFCQEVLSKSRTVLQANLGDLAVALHRQLELTSVTDYVWPPTLVVPADWDGTIAWIAAKLPVRDLCNFYLGLLWRAKEGSVPEPGAVAAFEVYPKATFNVVSERIRSLAGDRVELNRRYNEIFIWQQFGPSNAANFSEALESIMREWIGLWHRVPPADYSTAVQDR